MPYLSLKLFGKSWENLYAKFNVLEIKTRFSRGESNVNWNIALFQCIISAIVGLKPTNYMKNYMNNCPICQ